MVADFKASLMHVLEAICQQTELVLQHHVAMLSSLLPAVCEVGISGRVRDSAVEIEHFQLVCIYGRLCFLSELILKCHHAYH